MPKRLFTRSLLIIVIPMVLLQSVIVILIMERHWQSVTEKLSKSVIRDIAAIVEIIETYPQDTEYKTIEKIARDQLDLNIEIQKPFPFPAPAKTQFFDILDGILSREISTQIGLPFYVGAVGDSKYMEVRIRLPQNVLRVYVARNKAYASNTHIFVVWMIGTSLVLVLIAVLFLRNQIRPIQQLSDAAESFGMGRDLPEDFKPRGAQEVRLAGRAFLEMRERIERQIEQRTAMLAGVSHDLRTVLTRFRLQLAFVGKSAEVEAMQSDIDDMQSMLEGYMNFARGEGGENTQDVNLQEMLERSKADAELKGKSLEFKITGDPQILVRPSAFFRLLANLIENAMRHADKIVVTATHADKELNITIDDDGPGIPEDKRDDVFKPFYRMDEARNLDDSGTGLGLAIARDIAHVHGGTISLDESPMGGLRAIIEIPA